MTFSEAVDLLPTWVRIWVGILSIALLATPVALLIFRESRREALVIAGVVVATVVSMNLLYAEVGMVRLLGLPHVILWTPLAVWLVLRLRAVEHRRASKGVIAAFLVLIGVSLVFDYVDVVRYALGERDPLVEAPAGAG